jgi:hypothetical protein
MDFYDQELKAGFVASALQYNGTILLCYCKGKQQCFMYLSCISLEAKHSGASYIFIIVK